MPVKIKKGKGIDLDNVTDARQDPRCGESKDPTRTRNKGNKKVNFE